MSELTVWVFEMEWLFQLPAALNRPLASWYDQHRYRMVRAYLFETALDRGMSVAEANLSAQVDRDSIPSLLIHEALCYVRSNYDGDKSALIRAASEAGLQW